MRYFRIEFLDDAKTPGFMEVSEEGDLARLTDVDGHTLEAPPHPSYRTLEAHEAGMPAWGF